MIRSGMSLNVAIMLDESPQWAERHHPMVEMLALMNKPCPLHEMPLGAVVPSQYFASNDAKIALQYAADQIGRAHVRTPVTTAHLVCRPMLEHKKVAT